MSMRESKHLCVGNVEITYNRQYYVLVFNFGNPYILPETVAIQGFCEKLGVTLKDFQRALGDNDGKT